MQPLKLTDQPPMPKGFEKYQGMTLLAFAAASPMGLTTAMRKGGWDLSDKARAVLFPSQATIKKPSKLFSGK